MPPRVRVSDIVSKRVVPYDPRSVRSRAAAGENRRVSLRERTADDVLEARERYVARGVATPRLVVSRAEGHRRGRRRHPLPRLRRRDRVPEHGPRFAPVVAAIHEQVDRFLHQCFMVGTYEPYVAVCRRLAEHSPCAGEEQVDSRQLGRRAVENAVKIARAASGRPAVVVFENAFHGRTLLTMAMTSKVRPYKAGFGPFPGEVYRAAAPYPYRGVDTEAAMASLEHLFESEVAAETVACVVLETVQGEVHPDAGRYLARLRALCDAHGILFVADEVQSGVGRTGPMWAIEWSDVAPDALVSGKSLGGGLPLAAVTGRAEVMDAPGRGPRRYLRRQPGRLRGRRGRPRHRRAGFRRRSDAVGQELRTRLEALAARHDAVGEVRGLGPMLALELVEQAPSSRSGSSPRRSTRACCCSRAGSTATSCGCCRLDGRRRGSRAGSTSSRSRLPPQAEVDVRVEGCASTTAR